MYKMYELMYVPEGFIGIYCCCCCYYYYCL